MEYTKISICILLISALLLSCASKTSRTHHSPDTDLLALASEAASQRYTELSQELKNGNVDINYDELRESYRESKFFAPFDTTLHQAHLAASAAIEDGEYALCTRLSEAALDRDITDLFAHLNAARCYQAQGKPELLKRHSAILKGLLKSIAKSGDGRSIETAYHCNSDREVRAFVELSGLLPYDSTPHQAPGRQVYSVTATNPESDSEVEIYFDITASLKTGAPNAF